MLKLIVSLGIAAGAGMAIGLLTAPRKGKHIRARIKDELDNTKDELAIATNRKLSAAKKSLNRTMEKQQNKSMAAIDKIKNTVHL